MGDRGSGGAEVGEKRAAAEEAGPAVHKAAEPGAAACKFALRSRSKCPWQELPCDVTTGVCLSRRDIRSLRQQCSAEKYVTRMPKAVAPTRGRAHTHTRALLQKAFAHCSAVSPSPDLSSQPRPSAAQT